LGLWDRLWAELWDERGLRIELRGSGQGLERNACVAQRHKSNI